MCIDFPEGHDAFETVIYTLTRGDPERARGKLRALTLEATSDTRENLRDGVYAALIVVNVKDQFMIFT